MLIPTVKNKMCNSHNLLVNVSVKNNRTKTEFLDEISLEVSFCLSLRKKPCDFVSHTLSRQ